MRVPLGSRSSIRHWSLTRRRSKVATRPVAGSSCPSGRRVPTLSPTRRSSRTVVALRSSMNTFTSSTTTMSPLESHCAEAVLVRNCGRRGSCHGGWRWLTKARTSASESMSGCGTGTALGGFSRWNARIGWGEELSGMVPQPRRPVRAR